MVEHYWCDLVPVRRGAILGPLHLRPRRQPEPGLHLDGV